MDFDQECIIALEVTECLWEIISQINITKKRRRPTDMKPLCQNLKRARIGRPYWRWSLDVDFAIEDNDEDFLAGPDNPFNYPEYQ